MSGADEGGVEDNEEEGDEDEDEDKDDAKDDDGCKEALSAAEKDDIGSRSPCIKHTRPSTHSDEIVIKNVNPTTCHERLNMDTWSRKS
jgi:hypothetical protein